MEKIVSKNNAKIKYVTKLISDSSFRKKQGLFCVEGMRICFDAMISDVKIKQVFYTSGILKKHLNDVEKILGKSEEVYEVSQDVFSKFSDTGTPQGILCVCENSDNVSGLEKLEEGKKYIALENIQDPSNLGAICRTAEALGIDGAIVCCCCDIYNPKVLRGSMGSLFRLPILKCDEMQEVITASKEKGLKVITTVTDKNAKKITEVSFDSGVVCVIGNEGNGVSEKTISLCDEKITIPMLGRAQSLNASMAACITMWEALR